MQTGSTEEAPEEQSSRADGSGSTVGWQMERRGEGVTVGDTGKVRGPQQGRQEHWLWNYSTPKLQLCRVTLNKLLNLLSVPRFPHM